MLPNYNNLHLKNNILENKQIKTEKNFRNISMDSHCNNLIKSINNIDNRKNSFNLNEYSPNNNYIAEKKKPIF